jgi:hypothetical protein
MDLSAGLILTVSETGTGSSTGYNLAYEITMSILCCCNDVIHCSQDSTVHAKRKRQFLRALRLFLFSIKKLDQLVKLDNVGMRIFLFL